MIAHCQWARSMEPVRRISSRIFIASHIPIEIKLASKVGPPTELE